MLNKNKWYNIIFETDTPAGKRFDVVLLWLILLSVVTITIESVPQYSGLHIFKQLDWVFTIIFTAEFFLRIYVAPKRFSYIFSFWGIIDFLSILPTYLSILFIGYHYLIIVRILRLLRVFRILRLARFTSEGQVLLFALKRSAYKIGVFIAFVFTLVVVLGTVMYVVEDGNPGFSSIPSSIYWGIVTITTVGFGDIVPHTVLGKIISSIIMLSGYAIIAVPTGIVTVELSKNSKTQMDCPTCKSQNHSENNYCSNCGNKLNTTNS